MDVERLVNGERGKAGHPDDHWNVQRNANFSVLVEIGLEPRAPMVRSHHVKTIEDPFVIETKEG